MTERAPDRLRQAVRRELVLSGREPATRGRRRVRRSTVVLLRVAAVVALLGGSSGAVSAQAPYRQELLPGFSSLHVGIANSPELVDLDADGDLDAVVGESYGTLHFFENTGSSAAPAYVEATGIANPFDGLDVGFSFNSRPALVDLDDDGDLDAVVGEFYGTLHYFENTGSSAAPAYAEATGIANPFNGIDVGGNSSPELVDLDGDSDLDAVVGEDTGALFYFVNTGSPIVPAFVEGTGSGNPFTGIAMTSTASPDLVDLDGDGDFDAVVGEGSGTLRYFANTGSSVAPAFVEGTGIANPFNGIDVGTTSSPELVDLDGDGDLDAFVGEFYGTLLYFANIGSSLAPTFITVTGTGNPSTGIDVSFLSSPELVDLDGDGDLDAVVGENSGTLLYFANTGSSAAPGFVEATGSANPFSGIDLGLRSSPSLVDLDGDSDLDAVVGETFGTLRFLANTGSSVVPGFVEVTGGANPFDGLVAGYWSSPDLVDLDGDGDFDAVVGELDGQVNFFANTGTSVVAAFLEVTGTGNPFAGLDVGGFSSPYLVDLDGDSDLDAVIGNEDGALRYFANTGSSIAPAFVASTGSANPFSGIDIGSGASPALIDLDGDSDLDALVGESKGHVVFYRSLRNLFADGFESGGPTAWSNF